MVYLPHMDTEPKSETQTLDFAIDFATKKFQAVGFENHFLRVLTVLQNEFNISDQESLISAILHDTLEDTNTTYEELIENFSKSIADLVQECSHPKNYNDEQKLEYYEKLKTISPKAQMIKLADFTDNLRNIIAERKLNPDRPYHNLYITLIRSVLESYPDSNAKNIVFELTKELEKYVTS
jgi:(p)ppGpp synthase/HD superfamily hydrolase